MRTVFFTLQVGLLLCGRVLAAELSAGVDWEACQDNEAIDSFLRRSSPLYAAMARLVEFHGGYRFEDKEGLQLGCWNAGTRTIEVGSHLQGAHRATIIVFEMTNAHQQRLHHEVDQAVPAGRITTESEFALRHELTEYDGLRPHREVLEEIEKTLVKLPPAFFFYSHEKPETVAEYQLPLVTDFIRQMESSGHSAYYRQWFHIQRGEL
jgi:hypothetical protein